jgi:hypothetical protein
MKTAESAKFVSIAWTQYKATEYFMNEKPVMKVLDKPRKPREVLIWVLHALRVKLESSGRLKLTSYFYSSPK